MRPWSSSSTWLAASDSFQLHRTRNKAPRKSAVRARPLYTTSTPAYIPGEKKAQKYPSAGPRRPRVTTLSNSTKQEGRDPRGFQHNGRKEPTPLPFPLRQFPRRLLLFLDCFAFEYRQELRGIAPSVSSKHQLQPQPFRLSLRPSSTTYQRWRDRLTATRWRHSRQGQH